jgi:hypothetical protein
MKIFFLIILGLVSFQSFALEQELEIVSAEYQVSDHQGQPTLCLTILRVPGTDQELGLVEDIWDCHIARQANASPRRKITIDFSTLQLIEVEGFLHHLQSYGADLRFYFSEGE